MDEKLAADLMGAVKAGLTAAVKDRLGSSYNSPLGAVLDNILTKETPALQQMLTSCVTDAIGDAEFRTEIRAALRTKLAKVLVDRFGGELEKRVNALKSDPATRAKLTLAIDQIVKESTAK